MNSEMVCLTCGGKNICVGRGTAIGNEVDEKIRLLEEQLANRDRALDKLTRLTEDVRRDREEISRSLEKLRSLKLQSRQFRETGQLIHSEDVEEHRSVQLEHGVDLHTVKKTCQEVVQLLVTHDRLASQSTSTLIYPVIRTDQEPSAPPLAQLPDDSYPSSSSVVSVTPDIGSSRSAPESSGAVNEFSAEHSIRPQFTSAREVARVKGAKCYSISCVDDLIFVCSGDPYRVIKYLWKESAGKISIEEKKRSAEIESSNYMRIAAAKAADGVRLYVWRDPGGNQRVDWYDAESLGLFGNINTDTLNSMNWWNIAAWNDVLVVSDEHVICKYNNDRLVSTVPYEHDSRDIRLSSTFLATWNGDRQILVMRCRAEGLDPNPVYTTVECWGLAMCERLVVTVDRDEGRLVTLDLTTGDERMLEGDAGWFYPYAFAREDLVVGIDWGTSELIMVRLT